MQNIPVVRTWPYENVNRIAYQLFIIYFCLHNRMTKLKQRSRTEFSHVSIHIFNHKFMRHCTARICVYIGDKGRHLPLLTVNVRY